MLLCRDVVVQQCCSAYVLQWSNVTVERCCSAAMLQYSGLAVEQCYSGAMLQWSDVAVLQCYSAALLQRNNLAVQQCSSAASQQFNRWLNGKTLFVACQPFICSFFQEEALFCTNCNFGSFFPTPLSRLVSFRTFCKEWNNREKTRFCNPFKWVKNFVGLSPFSKKASFQAGSGKWSFLRNHPVGFEAVIS